MAPDPETRRTNVESHHWTLRLTLLAAAVLLFTGCPTDDDDDSATPPDPDPIPFVAISGGHSLELPGDLVLTAATTDGDDSGYAWTSSDEAVATVVDGTVTAVDFGEAVITATGLDTDASDTHGVVVVPELVVPDVSVVVTGAFYVAVTDSAALTAQTLNADDASYMWESSDDSVATVDADGNLVGMGIGEVTITATGADTGVSGELGVVIADEIPNLDAWLGSAHADFGAEAFRHWDEDDPAEVPASCAKCHSSYGFRDYIGADGTDAYVVDGDSFPNDSTIECTACHNPAADEYDMVVFPSGVEIEAGPEARCMTCHQGRHSTDSVNTAIETAAVEDDVVSGDLGFANIHYFPAAATLNAGRVRGGYQYDGMVYDYRFRHAPGYETCVQCHDSHSLEVKYEECQDCHEGVADGDDAREIRMLSSAMTDYDGDTDTDEGIYGELTGLAGLLFAELQAYATDHADAADICYFSANYPYFFVDTDGNGTCEESEANYGNKYGTWTPRLLQGAYNYQMFNKDPGAFAHNAKYLVELMYDSIEDLGGDVSGLTRNDPGHFNGAGEAARHWDEDEEVSASCSACHGGAEGFRFYVEHGVGNEVLEQGNGLDCATCHATLGEPELADDQYALVAVDGIVTPGGIEYEATVGTDNMCMTCHKGREDGVTVGAYSGTSFRNVHYMPAGGVMVGAANNLGYHYGANDYSGHQLHPRSADIEASCVACHDPIETEHTFHIMDNWSTCGSSLCHGSAAGPDEIRSTSTHPDDYDGDADAAEGLHGEIMGLEDALLEALQWYAADVGEAGICYTSAAYPYFFTDTDLSGECESGEASYGNKYVFNEAAMLRGAHNYQIAHKDAGSYAHNFDYMGQLLFDSIEDLYGGDTSVSGLVLVRPSVDD
jgi:hypothetical protein